LSGAIPASLGDLPEIQYLSLNANKLSGVIPDNLIEATDTLLGIDVRYNAVHSPNTTLITALNQKHPVASPSIDLTASQTIDAEGLLVTDTRVFDVDLAWDTVAYTDHEGGYRIYLSSVTPDVFTQQADVAGKASTSVTVTALTNCTPYRAIVHSYTTAHTGEPAIPLNNNNANEVESDGELGNVVEFTTYGCSAIPVIDLPIPASSISELAKNGTGVATVAATDADGDPLYYSITAGNTGGVFAINNAGVITVADTLDYETTPVYTLSIEVSDGVNVASAPESVRIDILNENDTAPVPSVGAITEPSESAAIGTAVVTISATDADGTTSFIYSMTGTAFAIDSASGVITVNAVLDYETTPSYTETVTVSDGVNEATVDVTINIGNENDNTPVPSVGIISPPSESAEIGTLVAAISATDADGTTSFIYSMTGTAFAIDSVSGVITLNTVLDYETTPSYTETVTVSDGVNESTIDVTINIVKANDNAPALSAAITHPTENAPVGTVVAKITATDPDGDTFFTYSIIRGNDDGAFAINGSGVITVATSLDYETTNSYLLTVAVSDVVNTATIDITINVINVEVDIGGCSVRSGAAFDPVLLFWIGLSLVYLMRKRPIVISEVPPPE